MGLPSACPLVRIERKTYVADDDLMTIKELAAYFGVAVQTVYGWRWRGEGPRSISLNGRNVRYRRADVQQWVDERRGFPHAA